MQLSKSVILAALGTSTTTAFTPTPPHAATLRQTTLNGYLDDLSKELYAPDANPDPEAESREATKMSKDLIQNAGPSTFENFVDFADEVSWFVRICCLFCVRMHSLSAIA